MNKKMYREKYKQGLNKVFRNDSSFIDFVKMASYQYKLPIHTIVQIYSENQDYKYLATYREWQNFGRTIENGQQEIDVFDSKEVLTLFNIEQTVINQLKPVNDFSYINQSTFSELIDKPVVSSDDLRAYCDNKLSEVDNTKARYDLEFVSKVSQLMLSQQLAMDSNTEQDVISKYRQFSLEGKSINFILDNTQLAVKLVKNTVKEMLFIHYEKYKEERNLENEKTNIVESNLLFPTLEKEFILDSSWHVLGDSEDLDWYQGECYRIDSKNNTIPNELEVLEDKQSGIVFYRDKFEQHNDPTTFNPHIKWKPLEEMRIVNEDGFTNLVDEHNEVVEFGVLLSLNDENILGYQLVDEYDYYDFMQVEKVREAGLEKEVKDTVTEKELETSEPVITEVKKPTNELQNELPKNVFNYDGGNIFLQRLTVSHEEETSRLRVLVNHATHSPVTNMTTSKELYFDISEDDKLLGETPVLTRINGNKKIECHSVNDLMTQLNSWQEVALSDTDYPKLLIELEQETLDNGNTIYSETATLKKYKDFYEKTHGTVNDLASLPETNVFEPISLLLNPNITYQLSEDFKQFIVHSNGENIVLDVIEQSQSKPFTINYSSNEMFVKDFSDFVDNLVLGQYSNNYQSQTMTAVFSATHNFKNIERSNDKNDNLKINEELITQVLRNGSGFVDGKQRIQRIILEDISDAQKMNKLIDEYGIGGSYDKNVHINFSSNGMDIQLTDDPINAVHLMWDDILKRITSLVDSNTYLDELEAEQFQQDSSHSNVETISLFDDNFIDESINTATIKDVETVPIIEPLTKVNFSSEELDYPVSNRDKVLANIQAIKLLNELDSSDSLALPEEQVILAKYVGWGGLFEVFDERKDTYSEERMQLKQLLSTNDYNSMRESVLTAYYTSPMIIQEMYNSLEKMGFTGGRVLDPAMGTGNFFSAMPHHLKDNSTLVGVELDTITGKIAKHLQQTADIHIKGFEKTQFDEKSFDVVVGNVPFNNFSITDSNYSKPYMIHDYFFKKSLDLVKDGGIVAFITSTGTLDKKSKEFREELNGQADFLGAVRLPSNAFKEIAGTDVTTDIVFFQRNDSKVIKQELWLDSSSNIAYEGVRYNDYFISNPSQLLGEIEVKHFNGLTFSLKGTSDLQSKLSTQLATIQGDISPRLAPLKEVNESLKMDNSSSIDTTLDVENAPLFTYLIDEKGNLIYKDMDTTTVTEVKTQATKRLKEAIEIRQEVQKIISLQQDNYSMEDFDNQLEILNQKYDTFVAKHGYLNKFRQQLQKDMYYPILLSIEEKNDDDTYSKTPIMFEPTVRPQKQLDHADTAIEALHISLSEYGKVNLNFMSDIYNQNEEVILKELENHLFLDPATNEWVTREEYLSGDVKDKLILAKASLHDNPLYQKNVDELAEIQPKPIKSSDIEVDIGSTWLPKELYKQFSQDALGLTYKEVNYLVEFDYEAFRGTWFIKGINAVSSSYLVTDKYGTKRANALRILNDSLNLKKIEIYDSEKVWEDGKEKTIRTLNPKETMLARAKQVEIHSAFKNWLFKDYEREQQIVELYNEKFNRFVPRVYDGSHLDFSTLNKNYELRPHQKNVVSRITAEGRGLMAHVVGAGKTLSMISAGMKLKEQGTINKPMYVVPNHLINEFALDIVKFYPTKNVLITTKKDFQKENRKNFIAKIASGNFDAVVIGHSQFERIPLSVTRQVEIIQRQIDEISSAIEEQKSKDGKSWSFKQMLRFEKTLNEKLEKLINSDKKDDHLTFEQTGVDFLFVDEAHVYKNLYTYTKLSNVAGVNSSNSQRATDMMMKCEYLQETNGHYKGVVMATGTPISNSMSELYTMQRYLQPDMLEKLDCKQFDSWASTFGKITSSLEITPEGSGYQMKNRFSEFHNLPELMAGFSEVADIQTSDMVKLPTPDIKTGKAQVIVTEPTKVQEELMELFAERAEMIRSGMVEPSEDNLLKLTHEAKLMAIDVRLLDESLPSGTDSKLSACCDKVFEVWQKSADKSSTQMIFSDSGTPKKDKFNVYDEVKQQLIQKGIPEKEIAFIHDAKNDNEKKELFKKIRSGDVRVLLGSTSKVGTGTNIQDKLIAVHHVDCPWRPSDVEQRNGRIVRQGNENKEVEIFQYVTKGTFDSFLWQTQENKLLYINQVMSGSSLSRKSADLSETVLSAAEIKALATSNPFIAEKMNVDNELNQLRLLQKEYLDNRSDNQHKVKEIYPNKIKSLSETIEKIKEDIAHYKKPDDFKITLNGIDFDNRNEAGTYLSSYVNQSRMMTSDTLEVGEYEGFGLTINRTSLDSFVLSIKGQYTYKVDVNLDTGRGSMLRLENTLDRLPNMLEENETSLEFIKSDLQTMKDRINEPFTKEKELTTLQKRQFELEQLIEEGTLHKKAGLTNTHEMDNKQQLERSNTKPNLLSKSHEISF